MLIFSCCFFFGTPVKSQAQKENALKKIIWQQPGKEYYSENSSVPFLRFEGAVYGEKYMPLFSEKIKINSSTNSVSAELTDAHFLPLEETSLIEEFKNKISSGIEVSVRISYERKVPYAVIAFLPLRKNPSTGAYEKLVSFNISLSERNDVRQAKALPTYTTTSVLSSGKWYKIGVPQNGVYKMNESFLKQLGINLANIDPRNIRIYGSGGGMLPFANSVSRNDDLVENAVYVAGENDGHFDADDYVLFYGSGQLRWIYNAADSLFHHQDNYYSDTTYYFLTTDLGPGRRIASQNSSTLASTHFVNTFNDYALHEVDLVNCVKSGKEWFGESFDALNTTRDFQFSFPNLATSSQVGLWSDVLAHSVQPEPSCTYSVSVNGLPVFTHSIPSGSPVYYAPCANESVRNAWFNVSSSNITVRMIFNPATNTSQGWLNYLELNAMRQLTMHGSQMEFRNVASAGAGNVSEFSLAGATSSTKIWDVTDLINVRQQEGVFSNGNFVFRAMTDSLREFIAFPDQSFLTPRAAGVVENQNLHVIMSADFVIVTPPQFISQAERLAEHHRVHDLLTVSVVTTDQIYNEFSSGSQDVSAIRDFMRMLYNRNQSLAMLPKYLLLFGDASYDNKHRIYNNTNFIVSYQSDNSLDPTSTFISDDFFGFLDSNDGYWSDNDTYSLLDIGIGRMPLKSISEAAAAVDKVINYTTNGINTANPVNCNSAISGFGEWRNIVTYVADDEDGGTHLIQAEALAAKVDTTYQWYNLDKIYLDAYQQISTPGGQRYPAAQAAFVQRVERGSLFSTYVGHGGEVGLAHERVLTVEDIKNWTNFNRLSAFLTATCEFTRIDDPERTSAGEFVFLNSKGSGVALFTTSRLAFSGSNFSLCRSFNKFLFEPLNGSMPALGDI
ncbi:MAG: type IX secretion system sortase PorU, partial [Bacteroidia bacterium]|nr:type IX secretion system sortase PorU [Bacteroidia bacterium]